MKKTELLATPVEHIDLASFDPRPMVDAMERMAFQARNLHRAARIYGMMLAESGCGVILTLSGSLVSAGLKHVVRDLVRHDMVDAIVATGANIVDQDFFEGLGFRHYLGSPALDDNRLRELGIDRIYDTLIDEDQLRVCDRTIGEIADSLEPRPHSSREFIEAMGRHLVERGLGQDSIVRAACEKGVPVFCPAFSDCSAGFGLIMHQVARPGRCLTLDSARDFLELTRVKLACADTGLLMVGGGVPKNFAQDTVVAAELLGHAAPMHKYAVQLTVADERDGALSGSTLQEASSWGKVATTHEQMVYGEATITFPLLAGYAYHQGNWRGRRERRLADAVRAS
jgi:deoxyhypusine synthase